MPYEKLIQVDDGGIKVYPTTINLEKKENPHTLLATAWLERCPSFGESNKDYNKTEQLHFVYPPGQDNWEDLKQVLFFLGFTMVGRIDDEECRETIGYAYSHPVAELCDFKYPKVILGCGLEELEDNYYEEVVSKVPPMKKRKLNQLKDGEEKSSDCDDECDCDECAYHIKGHRSPFHCPSATTWGRQTVSNNRE